MKELDIRDGGVQILDEWIPYPAFIKLITERDGTSHTLVFNRDGEERAFAFRLPKEGYARLRAACRAVNPACYFQTYRQGQAIAAAVVFLTAWNAFALIGAIVCFFRDLRTLGWVLVGLALAGMLANIFVKRVFSLMKKNNGDRPGRLRRAREANEAYRRTGGAG